MPKYRIPVVFTMWGIMEIEASTLEDAEKIALDTEPLPATKYYVEDSLKLDKEAAGYGETGMTKQQLLKFIELRNKSDLQTNMQFCIDAETAGFNIAELGDGQHAEEGYVWNTPYGLLIEQNGMLRLKE